MPGLIERTLVDTLLEIRNGLIEFAIFSHRRIRKHQTIIFTYILSLIRVCKGNFTLTTFQQSIRSCCPKFVRNELKKSAEIKREKFFVSVSLRSSK